MGVVLLVEKTDGNIKKKTCSVAFSGGWRFSDTPVTEQNLGALLADTTRHQEDAGWWAWDLQATLFSITLMHKALVQTLLQDCV